MTPEIPLTLQGGLDSSAAVATGNIQINGSDLIVSGGGENVPALSSSGTVSSYSQFFFAGTNQTNASMVGKYSGEQYLHITSNTIQLKGTTTAPNVPESDTSTFVAWQVNPQSYSSGTAGSTGGGGGATRMPSVWYMPGDNVYAGEGLTLYADYLKNTDRSTVGIIIDGNGGTTSSGSKYEITHASSASLELYKLPTTEISKPGYTLSGFSTNSTGTGTAYSKGGTLPDDGKTLVYKLYAQWTANSSGGGGGAPTTETPKASSTTAEVKATTQGSVSTAKVTGDSMNKAIDAAFEQAKKNSSNAKVNLTVDAPKDTKKVNAGIPTESIKKLGDSKTDASLTVTSPIGSITFDNSAIETIGANAKGSDIDITVARVEKTALTKEQQALVGDRPFLDLGIESNGKSISNFGGTASVSVPYTPAQGEITSNLVVWYLADDGSLTAMPCTYANGKLTFTTSHFSKYVLASVPFKDIRGDDWFYKSAVYAYGKGLMSGTSTDKFDPASNTTRGMIVTMLYRNASQPTVSATGTFLDVNANAYYANSVKWANEKGISEGKFEPDSAVTREQLVCILYRNAGSPAVANVDISMFPDAGKVSAYATSAFAWAFQNGVIKGSANGNLNPDGNASRAEVATMLMNYLNVVK